MNWNSVWNQLKNIIIDTKKVIRALICWKYQMKGGNIGKRKKEHVFHLESDFEMDLNFEL